MENSIKKCFLFNLNLQEILDRQSKNQGLDFKEIWSFEFHDIKNSNSILFALSAILRMKQVHLISGRRESQKLIRKINNEKKVEW